jgi:phosphoglycolate phosphatase
LPFQAKLKRKSRSAPINVAIGKPVEAIIFDWDGVLLDNLNTAVAVYNDVLAAYGLEHIDAPTLRGLDNANWYHFYRKIGLAEEYWESADRLWTEKYTPLPKAIFKDVKRSLRSLRAIGLRVGLASNGWRSRVLKELSDHGLEDFFDSCIFGDEVPRMKPAPDGLHMILNRLGAKPSASCYVGDTVEDVVAARAAGVVSIALSRGFSSSERLATAKPDFIFPDLETMMMTVFDQRI